MTTAITRRRTTGKRRTRTEIKRPAERLLWAHPSWLQWWFLPNAEANPDRAKLITSIFCIFVESKSGTDSINHYAEMKARCEALGWTFTPGLRFTHQTKGEWEFLKTRSEHVKIIRRTKEWPSLMVDMEPYHISKGRRYHSGGEAYELFAAAEPWEKVVKPFYVYPPMFQAPDTLLTRHGQAKAAGGLAYALDHSTYEASRFGSGLKAAMKVRDDYYRLRGVRYVPGYYLRYLTDRKVMAAAAKYEQCWLFPHPKTDDRRRLFTPEWKPGVNA